MFESYLIEIDEVDAGLLLRQGQGYVFHAVADLFRAFEGVWFSDPASAERALRRGVRPAGPAPLRAVRRAG
jgi:hypothetical protein